MKKDLKFKELEELVNEKIKELNLEESKFSYNDCAYEVKKIINEIVGQDDRFYFDCGYGCNGNVVLKSRKSYNYEIDIKVRRKKNGFSYTGIWGSTNYYGVKKIEIEIDSSVDSIIGFLDLVDNGIKQRIQRNLKRVVEFEEMLESSGISFEDFFEMMGKYQSIDYSDKIEIAKKYGGEHYYKFY